MGERHFRTLTALALGLALAGCNAAPGAPTIAIRPETPTTGDDLTLTVTAEAEDPDGRILFYRTTWSRDGEHLLELDDESTVPASETTRDQVWVVEVSGVDDELDLGEAATAQVTIANSPPTAQVSIVPSSPTVNSDLTAQVVADDADGDDVTFTLSWTADGEPQLDLDDEATVPASMTEAEQTWTVTVVPDDGTDTGDPVSASVTIGADVRPPAFAWCAGGGHASNGSLSAVLCASPLDLATEPASNGQLTWYPGPIQAIAP